MKLSFLIFFAVYLVCMYMSIHVLVSCEEKSGVRFHGVGVTGSCESPDVGAGSRTPGSILDHWASFQPQSLAFLLCKQMGLNQKLQGVQEIFLPFYSETTPSGILTIYLELFSYNRQRSNSWFLKSCSISQQHSQVAQGGEPTLTRTPFPKETVVFTVWGW